MPAWHAHQESGTARRTDSAHHAFTLIELLVVIAILSLLVSILLPSLSRAKELANETVCRGNLKMLGSAFAIYVSENHYPVYPDLNPYGKPGDVSFWHEAIAGSQPVQNLPLWCPRDGGKPKFELGSWKGYFVSYGYNGCGLGGYKGTFAASKWDSSLTQGDDVVDTSRTVVLAESAINPTLSQNPDGWAGYRQWNDPWNGNPYPRHEDRCNTLWVDGHVSQVVALDRTYVSLYLAPPDAFGTPWTTTNWWDRK